MNSVELTDIFKSAYFLCSGGDLAAIRIRNHGKRIATFLITGKNLTELDRQYRTGCARVNPLQLRESLNHLRDVMFETLRTHEKRGRARNGNRAKCYRRGQTLH